MRQCILAIDDEPHMLTLLERIVTEKTGYDITTTSNSLEVPELLEDRRYDLIISDLRMPGLDGIDILKYIREHQRTEAVILITAFGSAESAAEARSLGVFDYITKPFKKEQILTTVERAMYCQRNLRDKTILDDLLSREPFERALEGFRGEYIRRMAEKTGRDLEILTRVTGLPRDIVEAALEDDSSG